MKIAKSNLFLAPYVAAGSGLLAIIPVFWMPFCFSYLVFAIVMGGLGFFLYQWDVRGGDSFGLGVFFAFFLGNIGGEWFLPADVASIWSPLCRLQFGGAFVFAAVMLRIIFRKQLERDHAKGRIAGGSHG